MKKSSSELKSIAKETLIGHYGLPMGAYVLLCLVSGVITMVLTAVFPLTNTVSSILYMICTIIVSLLTAIFSTGLAYLLLNMSRHRDTSLKDLFFGFSHQPDRIIVLTLLIGLIATACVFPGIIFLIFGDFAGLFMVRLLGILLLIGGCLLAFYFTFSYSQVFYLYLDHPEKGVWELMRESQELMRGNKGRYFYLIISFFGLLLLSVFTCYIGLLWLAPYMEMTQLLFYRDLIGEL